MMQTPTGADGEKRGNAVAIWMGGDLLEQVAALAAAALAGGVIGLHRSMHGKPAGMRVHALVCLAAAHLTVVGTSLGNNGDTSRVIQGLVTGIGFLGAGVILHRASDDGRNHVYNLATATTIWLVSVIGIGFGLHLYAISLSSVVLTLLVLSLFVRVDRLFYGRYGTQEDFGDPIE